MVCGSFPASRTELSSCLETSGPPPLKYVPWYLREKPAHPHLDLSLRLSSGLASSFVSIGFRFSHMARPRHANIPKFRFGLREVRYTRIPMLWLPRSPLLTVPHLTQPLVERLALIWDRNSFRLCFPASLSGASTQTITKGFSWREWPGQVCTYRQLPVAQLENDLGAHSGGWGLLYKEYECCVRFLPGVWMERVKHWERWGTILVSVAWEAWCQFNFHSSPPPSEWKIFS